MKSDYPIQLNFLPVKNALPSFRIYRKARMPSELRPDNKTTSYSFAKEDDREDRQLFWVRREPLDEFTEYTAQPNENNALTRWALFCGLQDAVRAKLSENEFITDATKFIAEVSLIMRKHSEGSELLVLQPYFLRETQQFGCLADFRFHLNSDVPFSRKIQQHSLSLDRQFKRNLDFYIDKTSRVRKFLAMVSRVLSEVILPGASSPIAFNMDFVELPGRRLRSKVYVFANNRESRSQFSGLREHGPLQQLEESPTLLFIFREEDRSAARTLAMALRGTKGRERFSFPGFETLFKTELQIDGNPIILPSVSEKAMATALKQVKDRLSDTALLLPVVVLPDGDDNGYLAHKADFSHEGIPTQVCTLKVINDPNTLKWAIANIALQVFCKAGGHPWKVRPSTEPTLIVGISQSHKVRTIDDSRTVDKYFAFSVMTDNSGLFQSIQVLGESEGEDEYLQQLRDNLRAAISDGSRLFKRVVVHTSFKLKRAEMLAIEDTVAEAAGHANFKDCQFAVVKVNQKCRFFGINQRVNSLVPYEGTAVKLGGREYLVWFEGIFPDKPTVTKAYSGPTHLQFLHLSNDEGIADLDLLEDLVNLSGANWRGFNAKSAPVSVFYCHLVAERVHDFHERGLPLPEVTLLRPWFL